MPPSAKTPYWTDEADGAPISICAILVEAQPDHVAVVQRAHGEGVAELLAAGLTAHAAGEHRLAREQLTRAGRLCVEPLGYYPPEPGAR